ncbi:MAG TPA: hypothetical protein DCM08_13270 [Microscillaceae bacterium]|nr:hypothetical protein [Microscillaceae bacterium]
MANLCAQFYHGFLNFTLAMPTSAEDFTQQLQPYLQDLLWMSESDEPLTAATWDKAPTPAELLQTYSLTENAKVEEVPLEAFFANATTPQDWHDEIAQNDVKRFQQLLDFIHQTLQNPQVWRLGEVNVVVVVCGQVHESLWGGFTTQLIET